MDFLGWLLDTSGFPARWHCGRWPEFLGWLHIGSDLAIFGAYTAIPVTLAALVTRRRDLPFHFLFWSFAAFIISCGITHLNEAIIFWHPIYRLQGVTKLATGAVSWLTVFALIPATRKALTLRTPDQMEAEVKRRTEELRLAQAELSAARDELEQRVVQRTLEFERSNRDLEQFAYSASHDLQEPLRMVASFTQLLKDEYGDKLGPEGNEYIEFANGGAVRMQCLLHDLLAYSRVGRTDEGTRRADLRECLGAALENLRVAVEAANARLELPEEDVTLAIPPPLLTQLLQNLLGNAIKFRRPDVSPHVRVRTQVNGETVRVTVSDDGIGFDARHAERIFSVFRRLHSEDEFEGSGIGLAVCQRIVERYGGRIWAEGTPGKGARFHFELPRANEAAADEGEKGASSPAPHPSR